MDTKEITINGKKLIFLRYKEMWVFPFITCYLHGLGSPIALILYYEEHDHLYEFAYLTVNLPDGKRNAGCQYIDTNNNGSEVLDWLEENEFGKRTGNLTESGFCSYPEFNFYKGEKFWEYKGFCDKIGDPFNL